MTINKFLMNKGVKSNAEKITILQMVQWVDEWQEQEQLNIPVVISRLKERLEINAGRLAEPLLKQGKQPKEDKDCHKAFLMLAHLGEIEDYLNGL